MRVFYYLNRLKVWAEVTVDDLVLKLEDQVVREEELDLILTNCLFHPLFLHL